ncbi:histidinol dehydrogenase [Treponema brennaborense]|uniref:Histidinol dehydrogenase n=1 Tax=Treponema brennaborense (strain DSM 12168 / CIP 105900 / DD5/3) TaxID=906968 RepID=F4LMA5_TREBD|nr:histidinol dehydrogenase [Treponema brennaborense]AEE17771.1 Histidinol dehydrogenase [Treponema brennaborense DSM 12168]
MTAIKTVPAAQLPAAFFEPRIFEKDTEATVSDILRRVRTDKDAALHEFARKFDRADPHSFQIAQSDLDCAVRRLEAENAALHGALCYSHDLALRFALKQRESFTNFEAELEPGIITGQRTIAVDRAGLYVPAGRFPLLSTVIMASAPAIAAGCGEVVLCTPPRPHPNDKTLPYADEGIMAAAALCGVHRVFACGGAQAIAAMAYGTESIPRCDVIVGPGNKFVAEAKRQVYGTAGIDMIAGPTEVFIIADSTANPAWIAADMLAQAEHDPDAQAVLATPDAALARNVSAELEKQLAALATAEIARTSIERHGLIIITDSLEQAARIADKKAPEHLELALEAGPALDALAASVRNYGSLFIGHGSAEVLGDYAAGLNHTLPTSTSARFTGGLSVRCFLKTVTTLRTKGESAGFHASAEAASILGETEGLAGHAHAARIRL